MELSPHPRNDADAKISVSVHAIAKPERRVFQVPVFIESFDAQQHRKGALLVPTGKFGPVTPNWFVAFRLNVLYGTDIVRNGFIGVSPMQLAEPQDRRQATLSHVH
jgi:hypothetical protein